MEHSKLLYGWDNRSLQQKWKLRGELEQITAWMQFRHNELWLVVRRVASVHDIKRAKHLDVIKTGRFGCSVRPLTVAFKTGHTNDERLGSNSSVTCFICTVIHIWPLLESRQHYTHRISTYYTWSVMWANHLNLLLMQLTYKTLTSYCLPVHLVAARVNEDRSPTLHRLVRASDAWCWVRFRFRV